MGQAESKRLPSAQVQPSEQKFLSAHHPEKAKTPTTNATGTSSGKNLTVAVSRVRRKSVDTAIEEIKNSLEDKPDPNATITSSDGKNFFKAIPKSPLFKRLSGHASGAEAKAKGKQGPTENNLTVPAWFDALTIPGRRSRRQSAEQGPINMKSLLGQSESWDDDGLPKIPPHEIFAPTDEDEDETRTSFRGRANTIGNGQIPRLARAPSKESIVNQDKNVKVPVVLRFTNTSKTPPSQVYFAGSMTNWKSVEMAVCKGDKEFNLILDCAPGKYFYKFCVDGQWCVDESQPISTVMCRKVSGGGHNKSGKVVKANVITVKQEDMCVFQALACDSFATRSIDKYSDKSWGQHKPKFDLNSTSSSSSGPPILPPQLLNNLLNKEAENSDPILLPEPSSHVMLNHLYAQSIRDNMLVMASTTRYRKKCVTIVYYRPIVD